MGIKDVQVRLRSCLFEVLCQLVGKDLADQIKSELTALNNQQNA